MRVYPFLNVILCGVLLASIGHARLDKIPGSRYTSARSSAMGDAFLPLATDSSALFVNPAAMGLMSKAQVEVMNFQIQGGMDYFSQLGMNSYNLSSLSSYSGTLKSNPGSQPSVGLSFFPNFSFKGLAFGLLAQTQFTATYDESADTITSIGNYQLIPTAGGALSLAQGIVRLGYSIQWVHQLGGEKTVASTGTLAYSDSVPGGSGFSHTVGFGITPPVRYLPALNVVARNLLGTQYSSFNLIPLGSNTTGTPEDESMSIDASLSIEPRLGRITIGNFVFELRDLTNSSGFSMMQRLALGMEINIGDRVFLRAGYGSGYPSAGLSFKRPRGEFSIGWFSEEVGTSSTSQQDTKLAIQWQIRAY